MAKTNKIYEITILKWENHNPNRKKSYTHTLIANNLIHHTMLGTVPVTVRYLWIALLLICGSLGRAVIELSESRLRELLESSWSTERALGTLQSFQLLTYREIQFTPYIKGIEENRIEENRKESVPVVKPKPPVSVIEDNKSSAPEELPWLARTWNEIVTALPKVKSCNTARIQKMKTAILKRPEKSEWEQIFRAVQESDFLSGRDSKWTNCGFDWILNDTNATKVFEGNYKNRSAPGGKPPRGDGSQYAGVGE